MHGRCDAYRSAVGKPTGLGPAYVDSGTFDASPAGTTFANMAPMMSTGEQELSDVHILRALWAWYERSRGKLLLGPAVLLTTLAASGFPPWRVAIVAGGIACTILLHRVMLWRVERPEALRKALVLTSLFQLPMAALQ